MVNKNYNELLELYEQSRKENESLKRKYNQLLKQLNDLQERESRRYDDISKNCSEVVTMFLKKQEHR